MSELGRLAVVLGFLVALWGIVASVLGAIRRDDRLVASGKHAAYAFSGLTGIAVAALLTLLLQHDFNVEYVASYSSSSLPVWYTIAALWGGMKGSLLWWTFILAVCNAVVQVQNRDKNRDQMPWVTATMLVVGAFFLSLLVFITDPFERLPFTPREGSDLNPLLQNYWMTIHPPSLYIGFVSTTVPFAFAIAALATGKLGDAWIRTTRRWALFSWFFLSLGNLFGAAWAYVVLGWGGYWAWDPVENAAFMPWLTATAYLHSVMIQEKKDMLKVWNMALVILTFSLTIFGTFLTRSGVISSVHSFTQSGMGPFFMYFLLAILLVSIGLVVWRLPLLRSRNELESVFSREATFLLNNLILVGIAFTVFWGTVFPVLSEWVRGVKITVGPPFFNKVNAPLGVALVFLMGVGPVIAWRKATATSLWRSFAAPMGTGVAIGAIAFALGARNFYAVLAFSVAAFALATVWIEFWRGMRVRQAMMGEKAWTALSRLIGKNRRRYGGYVVHVGIVMIFIGIVASSVFKLEVQRSMKIGESLAIGGYTVRYDGIHQESDDHVDSTYALVSVLEGEGAAAVRVGEVRPEKRFYKKPKQPTTEVSIWSTLRDDLYVVLGSYDPPSQLAVFQVFVNPMIAWMWIGGVVLALGTGICMWPSYSERSVTAQARIPAGSRPA
ncbi:MAG: heme lyase CcmF/NrfE family subunit [Deltaproteobacteria bacterium]|nr:heme lyase CcmF/NrfE family subunit [Deltaproteobacteria bacterium]